MKKAKETKLRLKWPKHIPKWIKNLFLNKSYVMLSDVFVAAEEKYGKMNWRDKEALESLLVDYREFGLFKLNGNMLIPHSIPEPCKVITFSNGFRDY